jgi:hypothetical protein
MNGEAPGILLPSISRLLKEVGALDLSGAVDFAAVSRQPVFGAEPWRKSISEFLRWSGSTLDVSGGASVFELILCHGRSGALALFKAFREHLVERGGSFDEVNRQLEALRTVVSMAAHWLRLIDWDLDQAEGLAPADFKVRQGERWTVELPADLAERLKNAAHSTPGLLPIAALIERLVVEKVLELEKAYGGPFPPRLRNSRPVEVPRSMPDPQDRTVRSFWKKPPEEVLKASPLPPQSVTPPQNEY